ncbi:TatD family hydrolase [Virgibacillus sediminis]|uniref:TatD family hydrolase n=1 Tax=Virgibacillus sediminis TaxID=202260 RepID=A0ABV7A266_9BACI
MRKKIIDAHIHLDAYREEDRAAILQEAEDDGIDRLISVSSGLASSRVNLALSKEYPQVLTAFGYHPEQPLPPEEELADLLQFIRQNSEEMSAVGEVGLPYYLIKDDPSLPLEPYIELLEAFIQLASELDAPLALHAVYEDAPLVCGLLEKHSIQDAHFHWFKGDDKTVERMKQNGYYISVTPDVLYKPKIQKLARDYPLDQMMVETDGPWPFEGPFLHQVTHPKMIHQSVDRIAALKGRAVSSVYRQLYANTTRFYRIS